MPPATVLVIDDDPVIRMVVRDSLGAVGILVVEAGDAEEGVVLASSKHPQLVLLDIMLPRTDGLTALGAIQRAAGVQVPIIVFSATGSRNAARALELGARAYMDKPFDIGQLVMRVQQFVAPDAAGSSAA